MWSYGAEFQGVRMKFLFAFLIAFSFNAMAEDSYQVGDLQCKTGLRLEGQATIQPLNDEKTLGCPLLLGVRYRTGVTSIYRLVSFKHRGANQCFYLNASKNVIECR